MTVLEDVMSSAMVQGVVPGHPVRILPVDRIGSQAINLACRESAGGDWETEFNRDDNARPNNETGCGGWSIGGDCELLCPATEANRIALALAAAG